MQERRLLRSSGARNDMAEGGLLRPCEIYNDTMITSSRDEHTAECGKKLYDTNGGKENAGFTLVAQQNILRRKSSSPNPL
jgi:hypothetical protein